MKKEGERMGGRMGDRVRERGNGCLAHIERQLKDKTEI